MPLARTSLCLLGLALSAFASSPGDPPAATKPAGPLVFDTEGLDTGGLDTGGLDEALAGVRELMAKGKWKKAKRQLVSLLAEAGAGDAVVTRWPLISDSLAACTFWETYEVPEPEDVVPEIVSWKRKTGELKLRYERGAGGLADERSGGDFIGTELESGDTMHVHPMRFTGPYRIELTGRSLQTQAILYVDWLWGALAGLVGTSYAVIIGELTGVWSVEDRGMQLVDSCSASLDFGRPYQFEVRVASNAVSVSYNGKRLLKIKRPKGPYGQLGLMNIDSFEEVEIQGEVEPAWIVGLVQDEVLGAWNAFTDRYDALGEAPQELRERIEGDAEKQRDFGDSWPGKPDDRSRGVLADVKALFDERKYDDARELVDGLDEKEIDPVLLDWMRAYVDLTLGNAEQGYAALGRVVEADPEFYEGRLYRTWMTRDRESENDSLLAHEELVLDFPGHVEPYESLALFHLFSGRRKDAQEVLSLAVANEMPMQALQDVGVTLMRTRFGPGWPESESYASKYYIVHSNAGKTACVRIATELDQSYRRYQNELGRIEDKDAPRFPVYFFAGEAGYQEYCEDLLGTPADNTLGIFHPALKQLLVWDSPNPGSTMRTVRHEGFHQFFDRLVGESPVWLNEGMAEYYEQARFVDGRWKDDQLNEEHLAVLRATQGDWTPLETFVRMENRAFRAQSGLHYAQGWAFVHFMVNAGRKPKKLFNDLLEGLKSGATSSDAVEAAFEDVDFRELDAEFASYVRGLG